MIKEFLPILGDLEKKLKSYPCFNIISEFLPNRQKSKPNENELVFAQILQTCKEFKPDKILERQYQYPFPRHVSFLWENKISSRACFLEIMEFLPVVRNSIKSMLVLMKKTYSQEFFSTYIQSGVQFINHANIKIMKKHNIRMFSVRSLRTPFIPKPDQLLAMSREAMLKLRLKSVLWSGNKLQCLSFLFNDGSVAPPMGTYNVEPNMEQEIALDDQHIDMIQFARHNVNGNCQQFFMASIHFIEKDSVFAIIRPDHQLEEHERTQVQFYPNEKIVAVQVGTHECFPSRIRFLVSTLNYDAVRDKRKNILQQRPSTDDLRLLSKKLNKNRKFKKSNQPIFSSKWY